MDKTIARHAKVFRKAASHAGFTDVDAYVASFAKRLEGMYASDLYRAHDVYPTMDVPRIYAVIAMCLELREHGLTDQQIFESVNAGYAARRRLFAVILKAIDLLPNSYAIARRWNIQDHDKRVVDGSITYDTFEVRDHSIECRISACKYVEMFEAWGIRPLCKLFCETHTRSYSMLTRHVEFVRHSDLSDGDTCHDEIIERGHRA